MSVSASHVRALTGLRGVAVLLVVLAHAHVPYLSTGLYGVDVFFVLSGFLITHLLVRLAGTSGVRRAQLLSFLGRRAARLLPALAVTLLALVAWVLLADVEGGVGCLGLAATHTMNLPVGGAAQCAGPLHITWSLAAEEQFYLLWPLAVLALARLRKRTAAVTCLGAYAGLWGVSLAVAQHSDDMAGWWNFGPAGRPSALFLGAALAFAVPMHPRSRRLRGTSAAVPLLVAGLVLTGWLLENDHRQVLLGPLVAVPAGVLLVALVTSPWSRASRLFRTGWLVWLGEVSYSLYLVHDLGLHVAHDALGTGLLGNAVGVTGALAVAWALQRYVEQPARTKGYAWLAGREVSAARSSGRASAAA